MYQEAMDNVNGQIKTTVGEIGAVIKQELKKAIGKEILQYISPDRRTGQSHANTTPHSISQVGSKSARKRSDSRSEKRSHAPSHSATSANNTRTDNKYGAGPLGLSFFGGGKD